MLQYPHYIIPAHVYKTAIKEEKRERNVEVSERVECELDDKRRRMDASMLATKEIKVFNFSLHNLLL